MANKDLYGKVTQFGRSNFVTSDYMVLKIIQSTSASNTEYLIQNVSIQFNRPLQRIYEIGSSNTYFGPTRSIGSIQIDKIVGKHDITSVLGEPGSGVWTTDGEVEDHVALFMKYDSSSSGYELIYKMTGLVIESFAMNTDANGLLVQERCSGQFAGLYFNY